MRNQNFQVLASPLFLVSVVMLALNDWYLKATFHNAFTGKLSDFVGLFAFAVFLMAWLPCYRAILMWGVALGFVCWKSPFATHFIGWWSAHCFPIQRVVDVTDLVALLVLPLAVWYSNNYKTSLQKIASFKVYLISVWACAIFMATSSKEQMEIFPIPTLYIVPTSYITSVSFEEKFEAKPSCANRNEHYKKYDWYVSSITIDSCYSLYMFMGYTYSAENPKLRGDYEKNIILDSVAKNCLTFPHTALCLSHYQIDSATQQRINQTDSLGRKQGLWKIVSKGLIQSKEDSIYWLSYKNDLLEGHCKIPYSHSFDENEYSYDVTRGTAEGNFVNGKPEGWWRFIEQGQIKRQLYYKKGEVSQIKKGEKAIQEGAAQELQVETFQELKTHIEWSLYLSLFFILMSLFFIVRITRNNPINTFDSKRLHIVFLLLPLIAQIAYGFVGGRDTNTFYGFLAPYTWLFVNAFVLLFQEVVWATVSNKFITKKTIGWWMWLYIWSFMLFWHGKYYYWGL